MVVSRRLDKKSLHNMQLLLEKMHSKQTLTTQGKNWKATGINSLSKGNSTNSLNVQKGDVFFSNNSFPSKSTQLSPKQKSQIGASTVGFEDSQTVIDNKTGQVLTFRNFGKTTWAQTKKNIGNAIKDLLENFETNKIKKNIVSMFGGIEK